MHETGELSREPEFEKPTDVLIWASRTYLQCVSRNRPVPPVLEETFRDAGLRYMYQSLERVLSTLCVSASGNLIVHEPGCGCIAFHEQALIVGLRALQSGSYACYAAAMSSVLSPSAVRVIRPDMELIASALSDIERFWPDDSKASGSTAGTAPSRSTVASILH